MGLSEYSNGASIRVMTASLCTGKWRLWELGLCQKEHSWPMLSVHSLLEPEEEVIIITHVRIPIFIALLTYDKFHFDHCREHLGYQLIDICFVVLNFAHLSLLATLLPEEIDLPCTF